MSFFKKLFGKKDSVPAASHPASYPEKTKSPMSQTCPLPTTAVKPAPTPKATESPPGDPSKDPNQIHLRDEFGRDVYMRRDQWRDAVLMGNLEMKRDRPDELVRMIVGALDDGFAEDVLPYAAHLAATDTNPERGHAVYAINLMDLKRFGEAESVLLRFTEKHGERASILTNLARIYQSRGEHDRVEGTLWRAVSADPNHGACFGDFVRLHQESGGHEAGIKAMQRIAALPGAWCARGWLARDILQRGDLSAAIALYEEALVMAPRPVPGDLLVQISGDLGNKGHTAELIRLVEPHFDASVHDVVLGNNLIKAHLDLREFDAARRVLDLLYAQKRPDWKEPLARLDTVIAEARLETRAPVAPEETQLTILSIEGPVWLPPASPATELFPVKPADSLVVAFVGGSATVARVGGDRVKMELADWPGRLSRAVPLYLAEQVEFCTEATTRTFVPWIVRPEPGFAFFPAPWPDSGAASHARRVGFDQKPAEYIVISHLHCRGEQWQVELRLVRTIDAACLTTLSATFAPKDPAQALRQLTRELFASLATHAEIATTSHATPAYEPPAPGEYLLRVEQLLAVRTAGMDEGRGTLSGEREILHGLILMNLLDQPTSVSLRLLLAQTFKSMKIVRPEILPEFRAKVDLLQKKRPLPEPAHSVVARLLFEAFGS